MRMRSLQVLLSGLLTIGSAHAAIIFDQSPSAFTSESLFASPASQDNSVNFAEFASFATPQLATGMDFYADASDADAGSVVTIRIRSGVPSAAPFATFTVPITIEDMDGIAEHPFNGFNRFHADFTTPVVLAAGTPYFFGMGGNGYPINWLTLLGGTPAGARDGIIHEYSGAAYVTDNTSFGDLAFRVHGEGGVAAIPEPSTYALMLAGLGLVGFAARRAAKR